MIASIGRLASISHHMLYEVAFECQRRQNMWRLKDNLTDLSLKNDPWDDRVEQRLVIKHMELLYAYARFWLGGLLLMFQKQIFQLDKYDLSSSFYQIVN